jgi:hypothetical protein
MDSQNHYPAHRSRSYRVVEQIIEDTPDCRSIAVDDSCGYIKDEPELDALYLCPALGGTNSGGTYRSDIDRSDSERRCT